MNKKSKRLERYRAYLSKRIKEIQNQQDELLLRSILLRYQSEELEVKYNQLEYLIAKQKSDFSKQKIKTHFNNSFTFLFLN